MAAINSSASVVLRVSTTLLNLGNTTAANTPITTTTTNNSVKVKAFFFLKVIRPSCRKAPPNIAECEKHYLAL